MTILPGSCISAHCIQ